jgi:hypothetical protein
VLILDNHEDMFTFNQTKTYSETINSNIHWITLSNITFQSLHFKRLASENSPSCAIFFYVGNATGWGVNNNLSIYNCEFNGFYNSVQGLAVNSNYVGNFFHNYSNNALMVPFGANLTITANTFDTPANSMAVEQYQERDGSISVQGGVGLFLMDVGWNNLISDNLFIQDTNSTGIAFSSSLGNSFVTNNTFIGDGVPYFIDVFPRPLFSSGIRFYDNNGTADFCYDDGVYDELMYNQY